MIDSLINKQVKYKENIKVDHTNNSNNNNINYSIKLENKDFIVTLGKVKYDFIHFNVIYKPIYLLKNGSAVLQIGVYEFYYDNYNNIKQNINIKLLQKPLLFPFFVNNFLKNTKQKSITKNSKNWMNLLTNDINYDIINFNNKKDSLFLSIENATENNNVRDLRKKLSDKATRDVFNNYKSYYDTITFEIQMYNKEIKKLTSEHNLLKKRLTEIVDINIQKDIFNTAKKIEKKHSQLKEEQKFAQNEMLEIKFMKGINTIQAFKALLQTSDFVGNNWVLSIFEEILNVKFIVLLKENFIDGDIGNILDCNNNNIYSPESFNPTKYILLNYFENQYSLVTYKNEPSLTFSDIPMKIKEMISCKCLEKSSGLFSQIPDFKKYMQNKPLRNSVDEPKYIHLYDSSTVFQFYFESSKKPKPGKGSGEKISVQNIPKFFKLSTFDNWRQKLSNFWKQEFTLDGKRWLTVEHYYQGYKLKKMNISFYNTFSLDSNSDISKDPNLANIHGNKYNIIVDTSHSRALKHALKAKFMQNEELGNILKATKDAKLNNYVKGIQPVPFYILMKVREELN
tara:strand:+ start:18360 stop:20060 length:1701 start_codon:yes stop_codon:yes gene_type:complete